jgi:hypothetical protein
MRRHSRKKFGDEGYVGETEIVRRTEILSVAKSIASLDY